MDGSNENKANSSSHKVEAEAELGINLSILTVSKIHKKTYCLGYATTAKKKKKTKKDLQYLVIGDGPEKFFLMKYAKKLKIETKFFGFLSHKDMSRYLIKSDIFCLLSNLILISSKNLLLILERLEKPPLLKIPNNSSFFVPIPCIL